MKNRRLIAIICALGMLILYAADVFTHSPGEESLREKRSRSVTKFFGGQTLMASPVSAEDQSAGHIATTRFKVLQTGVAGPFQWESETGSLSSNWLEAQREAIMAAAVLNGVIKALNLAEGWGVPSAAATAKLRDMTKVSYQKGTDIFFVTVRCPNGVEAADIANAIRDSYAAWLESLEAGRIRRLIANTQMIIQSEEAKLDSAGQVNVEPTAEEGLAHESVESTGGLIRHASALTLLNTLKEFAMRESARLEAPGNMVTILEIAKPASRR